MNPINSAHNNGSQSKISGCSAKAGASIILGLFFFIPLSTNAPLTPEIKPLFYVSVGDFGESARNHSLRKLWSCLRPPIWTSRLSCRVRERGGGERDLFFASLSRHLIFDLPNAVCSQCPYHIYLTQMLSVQICESYLCPVSEELQKWGPGFFFHHQNAKASLHPPPREASFGSPADTLM